MTLVASERLQDRYEVVRSIKSGGMGSVYEAVDHKLASTPCAIKEVLASAMLGSSAAYVLQSFESEMRALAGLEHPNIPRVRDYFEIEGRRYIVLDLVQGQALDDELAEHLRLTHEPMDPAVAAVDMVSVLETLTYLHQCKPPIIHRDIKSANLIRDSRSGRIKMVDFGIARSVETQQVQTQVGTPGFCAPEQMGGRAEVRSDLFSVGATLYHLCTGRMPPAFTFESLEMDLPRHPGLVKIVLKATQPKPQDRYATAEEMAKALRSWLRNEGSSKIDPATVPPAPATKINPLATAPLPANSQNGLWAAVLAMLLAAGGLLYNDYSSRFGAPTPTAVPLVSRPLMAPQPTPAVKPSAPVARRTPAREVARQVVSRRVENRRRPPILVNKPQQEPQQPQLEVGYYPHAGNRPSRNSNPSQPPPPVQSQPEPVPTASSQAPSPMVLTHSGDPIIYDGRVNGRDMRVMIKRFPGMGVDELRSRFAGEIGQVTRHPENERGNEFCGSRRNGSQHVGFHIKKGLLYRIWVNPAPGPEEANVWNPILDIVHNVP